MCSAALQRSVIMAKRQNQTSIVGFIKRNKSSQSQSDTRRPAFADRTARRQFQGVFPVIAGSFQTNVIAHLHGLSMDLTDGRTELP